MDKPVTMTKNRLAIRRAFLDGKINAVCGYPGIGKTYLTMIHPTFSTLLGDGLTCCTADLRALPTWQDPGGDGMVYPCGDDCPFMKQFINEDKDEDIETNHSDGRA